MRKFIGFTLK